MAATAPSIAPPAADEAPAPRQRRDPVTRTRLPQRAPSALAVELVRVTEAGLAPLSDQEAADEEAHARYREASAALYGMDIPERVMDALELEPEYLNALVQWMDAHENVRGL
jgi:hypothetical protein